MRAGPQGELSKRSASTAPFWLSPSSEVIHHIWRPRRSQRTQRGRISWDGQEVCHESSAPMGKRGSRMRSQTGKPIFATSALAEQNDAQGKILEASLLCEQCCQEIKKLRPGTSRTAHGCYCTRGCCQPSQMLYRMDDFPLCSRPVSMGSRVKEEEQLAEGRCWRGEGAHPHHV